MEVRRAPIGPGLGLARLREQRAALRRVLTEYLRHYNAARPHRSLGQLAPAQAGTRPPEPINLAEYRIRRKQVLGGLTHEYQIAA
jgi:putative transposase